MIGPYIISRYVSPATMRRLARLWHQGVCVIAGIRIKVNGTVHRQGAVMYVSNHTSYTDIPVLGAVLKAPFVAKQEVANWPGLGTIAKIGNTIFVARERARSKTEANEMSAVLKTGQKLILFPEGTSNDGNRVLPFKSALMAPAELEINGKPVTVQPISITYTQVNGVPISRLNRPAVAWYGDMDLAPHLWEFLQLGRVTVNVDLLPPITSKVFENRKDLARHCHTVIRDTNAHRRTAGLTYQPDLTAKTHTPDVLALNV